MTESNLANIADYYQRRASEYDAIDQKPEQQQDFNRLRVWLSEEVEGKRVLEVACGTGYWTAVASNTAKSILATDLNSAPLQIARGKSMRCPVEFREADAFDLAGIRGNFDCGMAHFWVSHVPKEKSAAFLKNFTDRLRSGATVLFIDSKYVAGYRKEPDRVDGFDNAFNTRQLEDGSRHEVLKNYLSGSEMEQSLDRFCREIHFVEYEFLWSVKAILK